MNTNHRSTRCGPRPKGRQKDLFQTRCAPTLARMLIEIVDDDQQVAQSAHDQLLDAVSSKIEFAETLLRAFPERLHRGLEDVYAAARKTLRA